MILGITGGSGSGKTTLLRLIQEKGGIVLDCDAIYHVQLKTNTAMLEAEARAMHAKAVLYGHTHVAECRQDDQGMWILNPGTAGYGGGSAGLIETDGNTILSCRIITQESLAEFE